MPIVNVGTKQISYWIGKGRPAEPKETLIFIHGAGGGQLTWVYQKSLFEKQFNPILIDLPGHGESGGEGEEEIARYAEHVYSFAERLGLSKTVLIGHSMGGAIAQTLALKHPEFIKAIVLVGTGARLRVLPMVLEGLKNSFEETVQKIARFAYSPRASGEFIERGIEQLLGCHPRVLLGDFLACDRFDLTKEVEQIKVPTLVICGDEDQLTPVKYSEFLHHRIGNSRLEIVHGAGHMAMMEKPDLFNEKLKDFLTAPTFSERY